MIDATGVKAGQGKVWLVSEGGTTKVAGTITAQGANGTAGFVETSGHTLDIGTATIKANGGQWLLDPYDLTVDGTAAATISTSLSAGTGVTLTTTDSSASGPGTSNASGSGDIIINSPISWNAAATLTLSAWRNIAINANINAGSSGSLSLAYGQGAVAAGNTAAYTLGNGASITLPAGQNFTTALGSDATPVTWQVITDLGGEGSATGTDLQGISGYLSGNFVLGADIDASAASTWNGGTGFAPIGLGVGGYTGHFDGLGHTIRNLSMAPTTPESYPASTVGLFSQIDAGGVVRNLGLVGGSITGGYQTGALAGESGGTISNVYSTVTVNGDTRVGGLVGQLDNGGTITFSYSTGAITANYDSAGGIVGNSFGAISNSFATGNVQSSNANYVGGLVGLQLDGSLTNVYATGAVNGTYYIGGLVGGSYGGTISYAYASGAVTGGIDPNTGASFRGGLSGLNGNISNSYWNTTTTGIANTYTNGGLTTAQLTAGLPGTFDSSVWGNASNQTTPYLQGFGWAPIGGGAIVGTDTSATPTVYSVLTNIQQVQAIKNTLDGSYILGGNIDASSTANWNGGAGFTPIGGSNGFSGTFNGLGYTIDGLTINRPNQNNVGLFGKIDQGNVKGVNLTNAAISGNSYVGALVGYNLGMITAIHSSASVNGNNYVGGLAGYNSSTISQSYATGQVNAADPYKSNRLYSGGLVGLNELGTIELSYASGTVYGQYYVGGLVGANTYFSSITESYATGNATGQLRVGGLAGFNNGSVIDQSYATGYVIARGSNGGGLVGLSDNINSVTKSYWNTDTSGQSTSAGGTGLTAAQMKQMSSFTGWSMDSIGGQAATWRIYGGQTAPLLKAFLTTATVSAANAEFTYNGYAQIGGTTATLASGATADASKIFGNTVMGCSGNCTDANTYTVSYEGGLYSNQQGYDLIVGGTTGTVIIDPKLLTVTYTADLVSRIFGNSNALSGTTSVAGLVGTDQITGTAQWNSAADETTGIGHYAVTGGGLSASANYTVNEVQAPGNATALTITPRPITIRADDTTRAYGDTNQFTYSAVGDNAIVDSDPLTGDLASVADGTTRTGTYAITQGTLTASPNYSLTFEPGTLTVTKRNLVIVYNGSSTSRLYGDANPALTGTYTVYYMVNGDQLSGTPVWSTTATQTSNIGSYGITLSGLTASDNYNVLYYRPGQSGTLTITRRPITITADAVSRAYGDANALTYTIGGSGMANGESLTGALATTATTTTGIGTYGITRGTLAASNNYTVSSFTGANLTINPRALTVTYAAAASSRTYGELADSNAPLTGTTSVAGLVNGDSVSGTARWTTTATSLTGVGSYGITGSGLSASQNYAVTDSQAAANATALTINPRALTVTYTATAAGRAYGDANPALTGAVSSIGLVNGDTLGGTATWATTAGATTGIGNYGITGSGQTASANYALTVVQAAGNSSALTINPRALTVTYTATSISRLYGDANPTLGGTTSSSGLVNGDTLSGTAAWATTAGTTTGVGSYGITGSGLAATANYALTVVQAAGNAKALTINPRALTVTYTATPASRVAGLANPVFTGSVGASGLVNGDTMATVTTGTAAWSSPALPTSVAGNYAINGSGLASGTANYTFSFIQAPGNASALTVFPLVVDLPILPSDGGTQTTPGTDNGWGWATNDAFPSLSPGTIVPYIESGVPFVFTESPFIFVHPSLDN